MDSISYITWHYCGIIARIHHLTIIMWKDKPSHASRRYLSLYWSDIRVYSCMSVSPMKREGGKKDTHKVAPKPSDRQGGGLRERTREKHTHICTYFDKVVLSICKKESFGFVGRRYPSSGLGLLVHRVIDRYIFYSMKGYNVRMMCTCVCVVHDREGRMRTPAWGPHSASDILMCITLNFIDRGLHGGSEWAWGGTRCRLDPLPAQQGTRAPHAIDPHPQDWVPVPVVVVHLLLRGHSET